VRLSLTLLVLCQILSASLLYASDASTNRTRHTVVASISEPVITLEADSVLPAVMESLSERATPQEADQDLPPIYLSDRDLSSPKGSSRGSVTIDPQAGLGGSATIERLLERAIAQNLIAGGVAVIGNRDGILSTTSRGRLNAGVNSPLINERTIFDLASLTKVIATTPAVMKLLDEGRIGLLDPLSRWFPEFAGSGHEEVTLLNLLTHTSGLEDITVGSDRSIESAVLKAAEQKHRIRPNSRFHYADINFILLGELVRRASGETLDAFCQKQIYGPLGTSETMFLPPRNLDGAIAPTSGGSCGIVQDPNARRLGGVAGHAGLFASAYDLSRFARMILGRGMLDNRRILSEGVVTQMTSPYLSNNGAVKRGLGWDMDSPFSAPKGSFFSEVSFGHTGYSGSSIWIDPRQDLFVILLTNRVNYRDTRNFNQLRRDVSTVAAADYKVPGDDRGVAFPFALAKINAGLLQAQSRPVQAAPRLIKLASRSHQKWQPGAARRSCKTGKFMARNATASRSARIHHVTHTARAEAGKTATSSKKKRAQGRRA
jgi:CubicO group peptidase (beta-lactamase class C family)